MTKPFIRKGPVYVDGVLAFTATRDLFFGEPITADALVRADGSSPRDGDPMTKLEEAVFLKGAEFTNGTDR